MPLPNAVVVLFLSALDVLSSQSPGQPSPSSGATATTRKPGDYPLGPDSLPQPTAPRGRLDGPVLFRSQAIPNTVRRYWVYVPAQYVPGTSANVLVFQDGQRAVNPEGVL